MFKEHFISFTQYDCALQDPDPARSLLIIVYGTAVRQQRKSISSVVSKLFQHHLNTAADNREREVRERHTLNISEACMRERLKPTMVQLSLPVKVKHLQGVLVRPCMRVKNCPVYSRNFQKFSSKKKGGDSAPGCRASKLLDFRAILHLFLEAVSLCPGTCWLFILRMHFHIIGSGQCIVTANFHLL